MGPWQRENIEGMTHGCPIVAHRPRVGEKSGKNRNKTSPERYDYAVGVHNSFIVYSVAVQEVRIGVGVLPARLVDELLQASFDLIVGKKSHVSWVSHRKAVPVPQQRRPRLQTNTNEH